MNKKLATPEQSSKIINFLEDLRLREIQKEDGYYVDLRNNRIDNLNNLSNFLLVVSSIIFPITIDVTMWNKKLFWLNLTPPILLIFSFIAGFVHMHYNDKFFKKLINLVNSKRKELSETKYPIVEVPLTITELKVYIEKYHERTIRFQQIDEELKNDENIKFLKIQGLLVILSLAALIIKFINF
jgi:hypothetical protein